MSLNASKPAISIVTVTFNADKHLPQLIASLAAQTNKNFEWIVADGASTDNTLTLIKAINLFSVKVKTEPDSGIYDAMNKAVMRCNGKYYLVLGADDIIYPNAVNDLLSIINDGNYSFVTSAYNYKNIIVGLSPLPSWYAGPRNSFTGHSVGTLIKVDLHKKYGFYDTSMKIAADTKFLLIAAKAGESIFFNKTIVGRFADTGVSSTQSLNTVFEYFLAQIMTGSNYYIQAVLLFFRLIKRKILNRCNIT